jgi:zinc transport system permease protein
MDSQALVNAIIAGLLTAVAAGVMGVYIVIRRMVSISGSVAHASLSGVGLGIISGISPVFGALVLTPVAALGMGAIIKKTRLPEDTAIGMLWASGMALGVLLAAIAGNTSDLATYLFGDVFTVSNGELILMGALDLIMLLAIMRFYRELLSVSFDEEFSQIVGVPTIPIYFMFMVLTAITVVTMLRAIGIILVIALLAIPAALSRRLTHKLPKMMLFSFLLSGAFTYSGLFISYYFTLPSGAIISLICVAAFVGFLLARGKKRNIQIN